MTGRIALFLHQPKCSVQSGNGILRALSPHYTFKIFTRHALEADFFDDVDMICVPGGIGDAESFEYLFRENKERVQQFIQRGGRYLGICMGAYWAEPYYLNILDGVRAEQYITRPGTDTRRPHAKGQQVVWQGQEETMFFYDGCALVGDESKFTTVARYPNGDPMAIIQNRIGLIGCHPEAEPHWYTSYSWMGKHWHNGRHYDLLLNFADAIMTA